MKKKPKIVHVRIWEKKCGLFWANKIKKNARAVRGIKQIVVS